MEMYGSVINRIVENLGDCEAIKVGTRLTKYCWSDRTCYEVIAVISQNNVKIRLLDAIPIGRPMSNEWKLVSNHNNHVEELKKYKKGWYMVFRDNDNKIYYREKVKVRFGVEDYYYDYEF